MRQLHPLLFFAFLLFVVACDDDDDPVIENPEEVITDVILTLTPDSGAGSPVILSFSDRDGDGGTDPVFAVSGSLTAGVTYTGSVQFLNAADPNDTEDITTEVREEDEEHQVFYLVDGGLDLTATYTGTPDTNGDPVGLITEMVAGTASTGTLRIVLLHEPDKGAAGISIGNFTPAGGESDVDVRFSVAIQ